MKSLAVVGVLMFVPAFCAELVHGDDAKAEARVLLGLALEKEALAKQGVDWAWTLERGFARSRELALKRQFDPARPLSLYDCRWRTNGGHYLFEERARQAPEELSREGHLVTATFGTRLYLGTMESRIEWMPDIKAPWNGVVQNREHGFSDGILPGNLPVHGGVFGLDRLQGKLTRLDSPDIQVQMSNGKSIAGENTRVLTWREPNLLPRAFHFSGRDSCLVQMESTGEDGKVQSWMAVTETKEVLNGEKVVRLPILAVDCSRDEQGLWLVWVQKTKSVEFIRVDPAELFVDIKDGTGVFSVQPGNMLCALKDVDRLSVDNLDRQVDRLFATRDRELDALQKRSAVGGAAKRSSGTP